MKQQVKDYIDSLIYGGDNFQGDIIDLSDEQKDTLVLEWLLAYPSWQDDYIAPCLCNSKRVGYLRLLHKCPRNRRYMGSISVGITMELFSTKLLIWIVFLFLKKRFIV